MDALCYIRIKGLFPKHQHNENSPDAPQYVTGAVLSEFHVLAHSSQQPYEVGTIINSLLQMKKLRKRG